MNDGFVKKKGVMIKGSKGTIINIKNGVLSFLNKIHINNNEDYCVASIDYDKKLECAPEYFLPEREYSPNEIYDCIKKSMIDIISYCIKGGKREHFIKIRELLKLNEEVQKYNSITDIFDICTTKSMNIEDYGNGNVPFVTSTILNNAVEMFIDPCETDRKFDAFNISISSFGYANLQVEDFIARSHGAVLVLNPKQGITLSFQELLFYTAFLNLQKWRFSYGGWVTEDRLKKIALQNIDIICIRETKNIFNDIVSLLQ